MSRAPIRGKSIEIVSHQIEEKIPINYYVVGYKEWLEDGFETEAVPRSQWIIIDEGRECKQLSWIVDTLIEMGTIGLDTETTGEDKKSGLDPWREGSKLLLLQLGNESKVFLIQPGLVPYLADVLENKTLLHLGQNLVYDFKYLFVKYKIHINNMYDTMLAEQLLTSGLNGIKVGLADLARRYKPYRMISKEVRADFIHFKERGEKISKDMAYYAARDIILLFPVMNEQKEQLKHWKLEVVAQDEFNVLPVTASMELNGVNLDRDTLKLALSYWESRQKELEIEILNSYDKELKSKGKVELSLIPEVKNVFDLNSPAQKLAALRNLDFDIENVQRETLESIDHPIAKALAEYSNVMKVTSTYGENLLKRVNTKTGRLHPEFNQLGSGDGSLSKKGTIATGRYSSDFQQMPRPTERFCEVKGEELSEIQQLFSEKIKQFTS